MPSYPPMARESIQLVSLTVPSNVDVPQIVTRSGNTTMVVHDNDRWSAPLGDEIHAALDASLLNDYGIRDVPLGSPIDSISARVGIRVERFDGAVDQQVTWVVNWWLVPPEADRSHALSCESVVHEPAKGGLDGLVRADQRVVENLAKQMAASLHAMATKEGFEACRF